MTPKNPSPSIWVPGSLLLLGGLSGLWVLAARYLFPGAPNVPNTASTTLLFLAAVALSRRPVSSRYQWGIAVGLGCSAAGDAFRVDYNGSGVSDNRNALLMSALQSADTVGGPSYGAAWRDTVAGVGSATQRARIEADSSLAVLDQTKERRESVSGVSLDEEAANLIRFEQAYNASAQVISVARSVLQSLFDALG